MRDRRDRLRRWGLIVHVCCLLCNSDLECRRCGMPSLIVLWLYLCFGDVACLLHSHITLSSVRFFFYGIVNWVRVSPRNLKLMVICKLIFQAVVYELGRERNNILHSSTSKSASILIREIKQNLPILTGGLYFICIFCGLFLLL